MRERALLLAATLAAVVVVVACVAPAGAGAAFTQCPAVGKDTSCQYLITVTNKGVRVETDASQPFYDGEDDSLIGIQNESSKAIASIPLSTSNDLFGFDFDGLCASAEAPNPTGCVVQAKNLLGEANANAGEACPPATESCGFPPPAGEPAGLTITSGAVGFGANGDPVTGYEGPTSYFTNIGAGATSGVVNFSPPIAPNGNAYFALEAPPVGEAIKVGNASTVTTTLSGGGPGTTKLTVVQGTPVTDTATVAGTAPTGEVVYKVFKDAACTQLAAPEASTGGGEVGANGVAKPSKPLSTLPTGTYYWQATYLGDLNNQATASVCGGEILIVAKHVPLGLKALSKKCVSKRHFIAHPRFPKGLKIIKVEVLINGVVKSKGKLVSKHTTIDLRGLPKGTFRVTMLTTSITGAQYGDTRIFHTCVPRHHKKK